MKAYYTEFMDCIKNVMTHLKYLICCIFAIGLCRGQCLQGYGPVQLVFVSAESCANTGDGEIVISAKVTRDQKKCNVNKYLESWNFSLQYDIDESYTVVRRLYCKDTIGLWKSTQPIYHEDICSKPSVWMVGIQQQLQAPTPCPLPKGNYFLPFDEMSSETITFSYFHGTYKISEDYYRNGRYVGCLNIIIELTRLQH